ncbi:hypothetical protein CYMTET_49330 [Cymbomonas tetramitiformis]|uniref:Uncharacterized protein n=1 Tax=Cymbomonas tetramitiformis TaxID=36881 RepID=A0AAE0EUN2_9CHLO|nr:hypothetical protein CYMTET_49330 [Cymbomonas tetramitiformis]
MNQKEGDNEIILDMPAAINVPPTVDEDKHLSSQPLLPEQPRPEQPRPEQPREQPRLAGDALTNNLREIVNVKVAALPGRPPPARILQLFRTVAE